MNPPPSNPPRYSENQPTTVHVARARGGDHRSLAWLVRRLSPWLLVQARHRLGELPLKGVEPEDLVQEAWLATLPRLSELGARGGRHTPVLLSFLGSVLRNQVADLVRRRLRERELPAARFECGASLDELQATVTGALSHVERLERQSELEAALRGLPEAARRLLVLRGIEQVPYAELEVLTGVAANTLAARYRRLLGELRNRLGRHGIEDLLGTD